MEAAKMIALYGLGGGMTEGMKQAGAKIAASFEHSGTTGFMGAHRLNNKGVPEVVGDMDEWIRGAEELGLMDEPPVVVFGSPPCQGLTGMNAKAAKDNPKNEHIVKAAQLTVALNAQYGVFENIPRMLSMGRAYVERMREIAETNGYHLSIHKHQAGHFGVSQKRRRVMFVLERNDSRIQWPTHPAERPLTAWEAISDLAEVEPYMGDEGSKLKYAGPPHNDFQKRMRGRNKTVLNHKLNSLPERYQHLKPGLPWYCLDPKYLTDKEKERIADGRLFNAVELYRLHPDRVAPTLTGALNKMHPTHCRVISVREASRLMGYPDNYVWPSSMNFQQIAAGVCPPITKWFGQVIHAHLNGSAMPVPEGRLF